MPVASSSSGTDTEKLTITEPLTILVTDTHMMQLSISHMSVSKDISKWYLSIVPAGMMPMSISNVSSAVTAVTLGPSQVQEPEELEELSISQLPESQLPSSISPRTLLDPAAIAPSQ
jgi:hypothetical protein